MKHLPWNKPGQFWKGNLHTHSTESDGGLTPEQVCDFYRENGYDFLALTDHFMESHGFPMTDTRPFRKNGFTTLIGAELHTGKTELGNLWHILAVGLPLDFARTLPDETGPELASRALAAGAFVSVAHPAWYGLTEADVLSLGPVQSIETYNSTNTDHNDRPDSWYMLDLMLMRGHRYFGLATDDAHFKKHRADAALGWVQVRSETLDPESLLAALNRGEYYSSTGPLIHDVRVKAGERVVVQSSPAERIFLTGPQAKSQTVYGNGVTEAVFNIDGKGWPYCRVTVRDARGGRAWSNPIWFDD